MRLTYPLSPSFTRSAAGRGLNLQSSDTVVIYDPDPNPKNEEQAIARWEQAGKLVDRCSRQRPGQEAPRGCLVLLTEPPPHALPHPQLAPHWADQGGAGHSPGVGGRCALGVLRSALGARLPRAIVKCCLSCAVSQPHGQPAALVHNGICPGHASSLPTQQAAAPFSPPPPTDAGRGSLPRMDDLTPEARAAVAAGKTLYADSIESLVSVTLVSFCSVCTKTAHAGWADAGRHAPLHAMHYCALGTPCPSRPVRVLGWLQH